MIRRLVAVLLAFVVCVATGNAADKQQTKQNQMVRGTIKKVEADKNVLIVNQKVKKEFVQRELDISATTEFVIHDGREKKEFVGPEGLALLVGKEGANVALKCDKDVKVLKVTVTIKK